MRLADPAGVVADHAFIRHKSRPPLLARYSNDAGTTVASIEVVAAHQNTLCSQERCDRRNNGDTRPKLSGLAFAPDLDGPFQWR
jgi:hypothetical protein